MRHCSICHVVDLKNNKHPLRSSGIVTILVILVYYVHSRLGIKKLYLEMLINYTEQKHNKYNAA